MTIRATTKKREHFPSRQKSDKKSKLFCTLGSPVIFGTLTAFGVIQFRGSNTPILKLRLFFFIIAMIWNIVDLLIMDWSVICIITPKWGVIQVTEGFKGYKDYMHHFKCFLIWCVYTAIISLIISAIDFYQVNREEQIVVCSTILILTCVERFLRSLTKIDQNFGFDF